LAEIFLKKGLTKTLVGCGTLSGGRIIDKFGNKYAWWSAGINPGITIASKGYGYVLPKGADEETVKSTLSYVVSFGAQAGIGGERISTSWTGEKNKNLSWDGLAQQLKPFAVNYSDLVK
jgi:hypothetical protein